MGLAIFLRKRITPNNFQELLINSINSGLGNEVLLCSGFFQENFRNGNYQVSTEGNFASVLAQNNISLTAIGVHNYRWLRSFRNFRDNLIAAGVNVTTKRTKGFQWHAKIYILKNNERPIFRIVGSSNMTRNAFGLSAPFNYEADVVLWLDEFEFLNNLIANAISELGEFNSEVIVADYDPEKNFGLSIEQRLRQLVSDVENSGLIDFE